LGKEERKDKIMSNQTQDKEVRTPGYFLGLMAKIILAVAMLLYLGLHSYNFFTFTFKGDQWIFAILGLFTTSIGVILWLVIYLYAAEDGLEKSVAIVMLFVSLFGEFAVAGFDMYMNISGTLSQMNWTPTDLRNMSYIIAGLALLNGLAMVAGIAGKQIMDDLSGVRKSKKPVQTNTDNAPVRPMTMNALDVDALTNEIYARIKANGNGATDPTSQPRR
jgi:hypothetical protein